MFKDSEKCFHERKKLQSRLKKYSIKYSSLDDVSKEYFAELNPGSLKKTEFGKKIPLGNISFESDIIYLKKIIC